VFVLPLLLSLCNWKSSHYFLFLHFCTMVFFLFFSFFFAFFAFSVSPFVGVFGSIWRRQSKATVNCLTSRIMQKVECGLAGSWDPGSPQYWHQHDATDTCLFIVVYKIGKEFQRFHCARVQRKGPKISNAPQHPQHPSPRQFKDCRRMSSGRTWPQRHSTEIISLWPEFPAGGGFIIILWQIAKAFVQLMFPRNYSNSKANTYK